MKGSPSSWDNAPFAPSIKSECSFKTDGRLLQWGAPLEREAGPCPGNGAKVRYRARPDQRPWKVLCPCASLPASMTPSVQGGQGSCDQSGQSLKEGRFACVQDILHTGRVTSQDQQFPYVLHSGILSPLKNA